MQSAYKLSIAFFLSFFIIACSGGGGISDTTDPEPEPDKGTISITLSTSNTDINAAAPATLTATVSNSKTGAMNDTLVTFTLSDNTLGAFNPATGTALTNSEGKAQIELVTSNIPGAASVSASVAGFTGTSPTVGANMAGDGGDTSGGAVVVLTLTDSDGNATDTISTTKPGKLVATVSGVNKPVIVTFTSAKGEIPVDAAVTVEGVAVVDIYAGTDLGAGKAVALLETGEKGEVIVVVGATNVLMGSGEPFVSGVASISTEQLSAGGTATVSVTLQDGDNNPFTQPVEVNFTSTCASFSTPQAILSTPVTAVNGVASSTYLAQGCSGDDQINVTANAGGQSLSASASITILPASIGSIVYVSATPEKIGIVGTGLPESSTVIFKVLDTNGLPVSNQLVDFSLNTDVGDIQLNPSAATTNEQGFVQTVVGSGSVATVIRVTGTINGSDPAISSQSSQLVVTTGIPDQDSFSLSASNFNPEGWSEEGTLVQITAKLSDAFNNRVPDGTSVTFRTEGGDIVDSCLTTNGDCTVDWQSKNPRPFGATVQPLALDGQGRQYWDVRQNYYLGQPMGGRTTVTATAVGEESFADTNGNGRFDANEVAAFLGKNTAGDDFDLDEPFEDFNEDGLFNPEQGAGAGGGSLEELIDFDSDGNFDTKDTLYNGVLCAEPVHAGCASFTAQSTSTFVRQDLVLVMSGSAAIASQPIVTDSATDTGVHVLDLAPKSIGYVSLCISDLHNQQMPSGSEINAVSSAGSVATTNPIIWPNTNFNGARCDTFAVKAPDEPEDGVLTINVTTPGGVISTVAVVDINM
ncbi:hypothetical protein GCM10007978_22850 [Shewanella hanedai]|uniref:Big-1 domain-containing protein n=1 Tax=Shewanella hanedai TaxID=25 RepID=A0A553JNK7_SHEHA|nr:hypothetical protein [Shewanella hanedai]TRY14048.1 hypothetical protein FN961_11965 [Shewanella hanedai]GGI84640.1 hypothetical protein GCM10007978_22850 [Shewanella hanedai]